MNKLFIIIFSLIQSTAFATERFVSTATPLYETSKLQRKKVQIISGSKIQVLQALSSKSKVKIISEPYLSGRRNRTGTTGWISHSHYTTRTRRLVSKDELFDTVKQTSRALPEVSEPRIKSPCTSCETHDQPAPTNFKFQPGCEALKRIETFPSQASEQKLQQCTNSLIALAKKYSMASGYFKGVGGKKFQKVNRYKFFSTLTKKLNPLEKNFIGHILTLSGEAYGLASMSRLTSPRSPPHLQEMAAISMVIENRKRNTIEQAVERKEKLRDYKSKYKLSSNVPDSQVYGKIDSEIAKLRRQKEDLEKESTRLPTKAAVAESARKIKTLRNKINALNKDKSWLKLHQNKKSNITALDIALDGNGVQFSMYSKVTPPSTDTPNYPHWFKAISPDFNKARKTAIKGYVKFLKSKSSLPKNVMNYYSTVMRTPPTWATSGKLKNKTIRFGGLKLSSDPSYKGTTYQCGVKRSSGKTHKKLGHCFYSGAWNYTGHGFGGS